MNKEKIKFYLIELLRLAIILFSIYILVMFLSSLPYLYNISIFIDTIYMPDFLKFIGLMVSCVILFEFASRTRNMLNDVKLIPELGNLHSYIVYLIIVIVAYFSGLQIFQKSILEDWWWSYNLVFIGFSIFYAVKMFILIYRNSHKISENIFEVTKRLTQ